MDSTQPMKVAVELPYAELMWRFSTDEKAST
jgi:hypothetical protein